MNSFTTKLLTAALATASLLSFGALSVRAQATSTAPPMTSTKAPKMKAPAGLDLGAITPEEIAMSIVSEIVAAHRRGQPRGSAAPA